MTFSARNSTDFPLRSCSIMLNPPAVADAGDGGRAEGENTRLGDLGEGHVERADDALRRLVLVLPLLPLVEGDEDGAGVAGGGAGEEVVTR